MNKGKTTPMAREARSGKFVMSRSGIDKLNAVEGVKRSASSQSLFNDLDRKGASPEERRRAVAAKYMPKKG
jgi:hypothetical protein